MPSSTPDLSALWREVAAHAIPSDIHGPGHWARVERNGLRLAAVTGADPLVVRLFALFHDACRLDDGDDPDHGARGAELATQWRGRRYQLDDERLALLREACIGHTSGVTSPDPTIGTCWDADRLDLTRVGIRPATRFMSTAAGREAVYQPLA